MLQGLFAYVYVDAQIYGTILYGIVGTFMPVARAYVEMKLRANVPMKIEFIEGTR